MKELTFFTSNTTKLAHARYIAERYPVRIKGFRQRTYHANYDEPRLPSRADLLEASYRSALNQCTKAGLATDSHPFILEDTSVAIDALSHNGTEVPGLEIKYWMQEQTFANLDATLRSAGNKRAASVRSDVLLHVPKQFKAKWQIDSDYLTFLGLQHGYIAEREYSFESNLVYPWLDNRSFNKWFIPDGHSIPFGALPIAQADLVDFRRKAFRQLFDFLVERHFLAAEPRQLEFGLGSDSNLILSGYTCAGKTTASQHLARKFGYLHVEASDFMYLNYYYRHGYRGDISIGDFAEDALAQKPEIAAEKVAEYIVENGGSPIVVSGFRSPAEVDYLRDAMTALGKNLRVVFVASDEASRYKRLLARGRPGDDVSLEAFRQRDEQQRRMGLERIGAAPVSIQLNNNATLPEYLEAIDVFVGSEPPDDIIVDTALAALVHLGEVRLEDAILIALLGAWVSDENRPFFSTTQIARRIQSTFTSAPPKHKDNVSRYFNQDFYAYYEISGEQSHSKRRYRLSNTGYGMAIRSLRTLLKTANRKHSTLARDAT
ncbi:non-canonical purine NTP pyrophosphatase [Bradyrhizobium sp.]|uniref:non-canonical purine NTP pyrophosphatase n=1 Tax=Bradyrhizobium sp. TaxID=376 RepID=UPI0039E55382